MEPNSNAVSIFSLLTTGRQAERVRALEALNNGTGSINRDSLRTLILDALAGEFKVEGGLQEQDEEIARTRRWLLSALGRLAVDEQRAAEFVKENLDPNREHDRLVRYWALEGLIASSVPNLKELTLDIAEREEEPLVRMLAVAFLAAQGDIESRDEVLKGLNATDLELQWATLWALNSVPLETVVGRLCELVRNADSDDNRHLTVYRAVLALGSLPSKFRPQTKKKAASTLEDFVRERRGWPAWDQARVKALAALGNLGHASAADTLVEELTDDNLAIVREAALALEKVVSIQIATARIVEAAFTLDQNYVGVLTTRRSYIRAFADALRWMDYVAVVEELEAVMVSGSPGQQEAARTLLSEIGGAAALQKLQARKKVMEDYTSAMEAAEEKIRNLFNTSIQEARAGFKVAIGMDVLVFFLGVVLLLVSATLMLYGGGDLSEWAGVGLTGGTGVLGVLYGTLIAKPRQKVQEAVDHLMYLKVVFLAYLRQLHQADQAYTRHLIEDEKDMAPEDVGKFSDMVERTMMNAVRQLNGGAQPPE